MLPEDDPIEGLKHVGDILIQLCCFKWFDKYVQLVGFNKYWVVEIGWWLPRIEVTGDYLRMPRPTQSCSADDDDE